MSKLQIRNSLLLLLAATVWGMGFVAQSVGMECSYTRVLPFGGTRFLYLVGGQCFMGQSVCCYM